jgi:predicted transcriptional regulator YdeE
MEPKIMSKPTFSVVGMKYRGKPEGGEIPALWREFNPRVSEIKYLSESDNCYGVMDNYDEKTGQFDYVSAAEVSKVADVPKGMMSWDIPANKYAMLEFKFSEIHQAFQDIYRWIPESDNERAPGPEFEYYPPEFNPENPDSLMQIYIPIK